MENAVPPTLRRVLHRWTPILYDQLWKLGPRNYPIIKTIIAERGWTVQTGPFEGMRYIRHSWGSPLAPKLLGAYECELHGFVERALADKPDKVIDIGSAEGYYAAGFALRLPRAQVHAFDGDALARELCRDLVRLNGVADRVHIHGLCTAGDLAALLPALVISDCEGCELDLLDPVRLPELASCPMLVELHDSIDASISKTIVDRFSATHQIEMVSSQERRTTDFAVLSRLKHDLAALALEESRHGVMEWAYMVPRR